MDIVINLPDTDYSLILTKIMLACPGCKVIELPEGHGRLIDESKISSVNYHVETIEMVNDVSRNFCIIDSTDAPTIIEADKRKQE